MSKSFHLKKDSNEKFNGAAKHRFNAEYSDEIEFASKKGKNLSQKRTEDKRRQLVELH